MSGNILKDIEIRRLNQATLADFIAFHDHVDLNHAPDWRGCYCQYYYYQDNEQTWHDLTIPTKLELLVHRVEHDEMNGYLAYHAGDVVGWVSIDDWRRYHRLVDLKDFSFDKKTAVIVCILIAQAFRGRGLSQEIIHFGLDDLKEQGFEQVLALPFKGDASAKAYHGTVGTFLRLGFEYVSESRNCFVYLKQLIE